jgi:hypothetical protein
MTLILRRLLLAGVVGSAIYLVSSRPPTVSPDVVAQKPETEFAWHQKVVEFTYAKIAFHGNRYATHKWARELKSPTPQEASRRVRSEGRRARQPEQPRPVEFELSQFRSGRYADVRNDALEQWATTPAPGFEAPVLGPVQYGEGDTAWRTFELRRGGASPAIGLDTLEAVRSFLTKGRDLPEPQTFVSYVVSIRDGSGQGRYRAIALFGPGNDPRSVTFVDQTLGSRSLPLVLEEEGPLLPLNGVGVRGYEVVGKSGINDDRSMCSASPEPVSSAACFGKMCCVSSGRRASEACCWTSLGGR